jgi:hypothetical protein
LARPNRRAGGWQRPRPESQAKIFELLLRLPANHLWPAMHLGTLPFNIYPQNKQVAGDHAIFMGSSHIMPMLRNNMHEATARRSTEIHQEIPGELTLLIIPK